MSSSDDLKTASRRFLNGTMTLTDYRLHAVSTYRMSELPNRIQIADSILNSDREYMVAFARTVVNS